MKIFLFLPLLFLCQMVIGQVTYSDSIIGNPIRIGAIDVAQNNFPIRMVWKDAKEACTNLGNGWRLPTKSEMKKIYNNKEKIGGFASVTYWSSTELASSSAWIQYFSDGGQGNDIKTNIFYVRAVRSF